MSLLSVRREVGEFKKRYKWMALVVLLTFGGLLGRMIQLQLVEYDHYAQVARENITRTITLPATVQERDGCSRAVAAWNANAIDFDLFRYTMGTTRAASATVALTQSPSIDKAWFVIDAQRRFEVLGKCGTTGSKAKVTMTRTPEGAWSGSAGF